MSRIFKKHKIHTHTLVVVITIIICCACGMQKFPGQELNPSRSSDNAGSLTTRPPGNSKAIPPPLFKLEVQLIHNVVPLSAAHPKLFLK